MLYSDSFFLILLTNDRWKKKLYYPAALARDLSRWIVGKQEVNRHTLKMGHSEEKSDETGVKKTEILKDFQAYFFSMSRLPSFPWAVSTTLQTRRCFDHWPSVQAWKIYATRITYELHGFVGKTVEDLFEPDPWLY